MNLMTETMKKMAEILIATDQRLKEFGAEPYRTKKLTARQQRDRIAKLTPEDLRELVDTYGIEEVNDWIKRYGGQNGMV